MDFFVLAEEELIIGFQLVGIAGRVVTNRQEALEAFLYAVQELKPKVLILTEEVASYLEAETAEWNLSSQFPLLVEIPGLQGKLPSRKTLVESIREAIGIRV
ncbi:MAG: V-type ATP synthase subunit F [Spirochaetales bacterium]